MTILVKIEKKIIKNPWGMEALVSSSKEETKLKNIPKMIRLYDSLRFCFFGLNRKRK